MGSRKRQDITGAVKNMRALHGQRGTRGPLRQGGHTHRARALTGITEVPSCPHLLCQGLDVANGRRRSALIRGEDEGCWRLRSVSTSTSGTEGTRVSGACEFVTCLATKATVF